MDWLTFITDLSKALSWPAVVVVAWFALRRPISSVLPALLLQLSSVKYGKLQFSFRAVKNLPFVGQTEAPKPAADQGGATATATTEAQPNDLKGTNDAERNRHYMLAHVYQLSDEPDQKYDVSIFIAKHAEHENSPQTKGFNEIERAEFFLGKYWGNKVYPVENTGEMIGYRTSAWGTFVVSCRITFKDSTKTPVVIHRYVDFFMFPGELEASLSRLPIPLSALVSHA